MSSSGGSGSTAAAVVVVVVGMQSMPALVVPRSFVLLHALSMHELCMYAS